MAKLFVHTVKVKPYGMSTPSPIDMLRYDGLHPKSERDSGKIMRSLDYRLEKDNSEIELLRMDRKTWLPTAERWKSFSWQVVSHESRGY